MQVTFEAPKTLSESTDYESPWLVVKRVVKLMPSGAEAVFFLREEPDIVVCLPCTDDGKFVLVEEYRHGPGRALFDIPGGLVDPGEDIIDAAKREILEETGYAGQPTHLISTWISAYSKARKHIFLMKDAKRVQAPDIVDSEMIRVVNVSLPELRGVVGEALLTDLDAGLLCLQTLDETEFV